RLDEMPSAVDGVLREIGAGELPVELVLNKVDAVDPLCRRRLANRFPDALQVSARTGEGLDELRRRIAERFAERFEPVRLLIPYDEGARLAELYALGAPRAARPLGRERAGADRLGLPGRDPRRPAQHGFARAACGRAGHAHRPARNPAGAGARARRSRGAARKRARRARLRLLESLM